MRPHLTALLKNNPCSHELIKNFNHFYSDDHHQKNLLYTLPESIGEGYYKKKIISSDIHMYENHIKVNKKITMSGDISSHMFLISYCLSDEMYWEEKHTSQTFSAKKHDILIHSLQNFSAVSTYQPKQLYSCINLGISANRFGELFNLENQRYLIQSTSRIQMILDDMIHNEIPDSLQAIYLEGKTLELIALTLKTLTNQPSNTINKEDLFALYKAKEILDNSITAPPTIQFLSRSVCLNECKLKVGFKKVFGMPIYAYVLNERMIFAKHLLEIRKLKVHEVALIVGYANPNNFTRAFKKKYGINPSQINNSF